MSIKNSTESLNHIAFIYSRTRKAPLISLPTTFVRLDSPNHNILRHGCFKEDGQAEVLGVVQKTSHEGPNVVSFNLKDSFPDTPNSQILKQMKVKYVSDEQFNRVRTVSFFLAGTAENLIIHVYLVIVVSFQFS